jgi:tRNA-specific 2-thiouridylase
MDDRRPPKAVLLSSGGLDSLLTREVLRRAGVDVVILRHYSVFFSLPQDGSPAAPCPTITRDLTEEMIRLVAAPRYGLGRNANPCMDCKQQMYALAWQEAQRQGADFIATGEVLGQRPMSQNRPAFARMEKGAGVRRLVVRPLSGRLLPPTIPEEQGLIRRDDLLDLHGRGRTRQMELAAAWGIRDYPAPAGGCKLTEPQYAGRVLRLRATGRMTADNLRAARHGRFVELSESCLALVGRDDADNEGLLADAPEGSVVFELSERPGPVACVIGPATEAAVEQVKALVIRYSRFRDLPTDQVRACTPAEAREARAAESAGRGP